MNLENKEFNYINNNGKPRKLVIGEKKNDLYQNSIWSRRTGDLCSFGYNTEEQLVNFLKHYGINYFEEEKKKNERLYSCLSVCFSGIERYSRRF